ncbi:MAG: DUF502 domain-containing protein [Candidatus Nanohaloarchaea archaeon]
MSEDEKPEENLQEGKEKLQEGAQKILKGGLERGRQNFSYYNRNRLEILRDLGVNKQKKPAFEGLIVLFPLAVVGLIIAYLFNKIELIPYHEILNLTGYYVIDQSIKLAALITAGTVLSTFAGKAVRSDTGFRIEKTLDRLMGSVPFLGGIYRITKATTETVIKGTEELSKPVKVELNDVKLTAFKTGNMTEDDREILFFPTSPNITTGLILEVKPENIIETGESAEQALTRTLSAGFGRSKPVEDKDSTQ